MLCSRGALMHLYAVRCSRGQYSIAYCGAVRANAVQRSVEPVLSYVTM